jgi:hypothetical protein
MTVREQLTWQLQRTGYDQNLVAAVSRATLPAYTGAELEDRELAIVSEAIDVLAQAALPANLIQHAIEQSCRRDPDRWRDRFWRAVLRLASTRFTHAPYCGVSPLETDPLRLARWGPAPDWTLIPPPGAEIPAAS